MGKNDHLTNSPTLKFSQKARELNKIGHRIIPLGLGEPGFKTPNEIIDGRHLGNVYAEKLNNGKMFGDQN